MPDDVASFGLTVSSRAPFVMEKPHRHSEIELNLVETGSLIYRFGGIQYTFQAGDLAIFWGAVPHQLVEVGAPPHFTCVTLPLAWCLQLNLPAAFMQRLMDGHPLVDTQTDSAFDQALFRRWSADFLRASEDFHPIILLELEARLRRMALAWQPQDERYKPPRSKSEMMAQFIARHYAEPLTVEQIAVAANLRPNYAMSLFRRDYHMTLIEYLAQHRVANAQRLLAMTDHKIIDIALDCGFQSYSRFYEVFVEVSGRSPAAYRDALHMLNVRTPLK
ncbi:MAG: helix-turn-helix domain-containing protein [Anaerolineae bacterium]|nr:helix-turn-helix domain-containing protein [Anaerolineae bacterium]